MLLVPAALSAGRKMCDRGDPTYGSYAWDVAAEAKMLLTEMISFLSLLSWQSHAVDLTTSKGHVNRMRPDCGCPHPSIGTMEGRDAGECG